MLRTRSLLPLALVMLAGPSGAGEIEITPFGGVKFGGHVLSPVDSSSVPLNESVVYGGMLDIAIDEHWAVELLYSRQPTELRPRASQASFPQTVEHYMLGIQELTDPSGPFTFFGVALLGATRLDPGLTGADSELRFAGALSLGTKVMATERLGFRFEARVFYTVVESGGALYCQAGTCLFRFDGSGIWQGDVTAGLVLRF